MKKKGYQKIRNPNSPGKNGRNVSPRGIVLLLVGYYFFEDAQFLLSNVIIKFQAEQRMD